MGERVRRYVWLTCFAVFCFLDTSSFRAAVVVQGGWVHRFVSYVFVFVFSPEAIPALAGIVQRTTSMYIIRVVYHLILVQQNSSTSGTK